MHGVEQEIVCRKEVVVVGEEERKEKSVDDTFYAGPGPRGKADGKLACAVEIPPDGSIHGLQGKERREIDVGKLPSVIGRYSFQLSMFVTYSLRTVAGKGHKDRGSNC